MSIDTQLSPQREKPRLQRTLHWLPAQMALPCSGSGQTLPQAPQLLGSLLVSTQPVPHSMNGLRQAKSQVPPVQLGAACAGELHTLPQAPQFDVLLTTLTHEPPQFLVPVGQLSWHAPWLHTSAARHSSPQAPQWPLSDERSTHEPEQLV